MQKFLPTLIVLTLAAPSVANGTLISFEPSAATVALGGNVAIDIVATPEAGELIGAFDFDVIYDPAVLSFADATFGPSLNDDPLFCAILGCRGFADGGGFVNLFEASLAFPLASLQDGASSIVLATLVFDAVGLGTSTLGIVGNIAGLSAPLNILGDEFGVPLPVLEPGMAAITVVVVHEPAPMLLMLLGLFAFCAGRRKAGIRRK